MSRLVGTGVPSPRRTETALSIQTHLDSTHVPHLVNGLSLEITRQADRIRSRCHTRDWPSAASAMTQLEEAVALLGQLVNTSLRASLVPPAPEEEPEPETEVPVGQYL